MWFLLITREIFDQLNSNSHIWQPVLDLRFDVTFIVTCWVTPKLQAFKAIFLPSPMKFTNTKWTKTKVVWYWVFQMDWAEFCLSQNYIYAIKGVLMNRISKLVSNWLCCNRGLQVVSHSRYTEFFLVTLVVMGNDYSVECSLSICNSLWHLHNQTWNFAVDGFHPFLELADKTLMVWYSAQFLSLCLSLSLSRLWSTMYANEYLIDGWPQTSWNIETCTEEWREILTKQFCELMQWI